MNEICYEYSEIGTEMRSLTPNEGELKSPYNHGCGEWIFQQLSESTVQRHRMGMSKNRDENPCMCKLLIQNFNQKYVHAHILVRLDNRPEMQCKCTEMTICLYYHEIIPHTHVVINLHTGRNQTLI